MTEQLARTTPSLPSEVRMTLDDTSVGRTVVVSDSNTTGELLAWVEHTQIDPATMGEPGFELSTHAVDGHPDKLLLDSDGRDESGRRRLLRDATHPVDRLFAEMQETIGEYPEGTVPVWARIRGTAFFPGGSGLWRPTDSDRLPTMPDGQVMVIGQDYYTRAGYLEFLHAGQELNTQTWRELRKLFVAARLAEDRCFFTNAWMGLRSEGRATGRYAGARDRGFTRRCSAAFGAAGEDYGWTSG